MKTHRLKEWTVLGVTLFFSSAVLAQDSFRTAGGRLVEEGMTMGEVLIALGPPNASVPEGDLNVDIGQSVKTWRYRLNSSLGGPYLVTITFEGGDVRNVEALSLRN